MHAILVLQLLVLQLALQLLRLGDLAYCPVEVVLVDHVPLSFERKEPTMNRSISNILVMDHARQNRVNTYASVTTFLRSAPLSPSLILTTLSKSRSDSVTTL